VRRRERAGFTGHAAGLRYDAAMSELQDAIDTFTARLAALIEERAMSQARSAVLAAFGTDTALPKRRGRPPKALEAAAPANQARVKARKKAPRQLCPVPGCKNTAAPIFGMVCAKHKDLPKAKIKAFRDARKAKKLGLAAGKKTNKKTKTKTAKPRTSKRTATKLRAKAAKLTRKPVAKRAKPAPRGRTKRGVKLAKVTNRPAASPAPTSATANSPTPAVATPAP
jgi:hypothetical protein